MLRSSAGGRDAPQPSPKPQKQPEPGPVFLGWGGDGCHGNRWALAWESHSDERGSVSKPTSHGRNPQAEEAHSSGCGLSQQKTRRTQAGAPGQGQVTEIMLPP